MEEKTKQKLEQVKARYAHWNKESLNSRSQNTLCGTDCSDIGGGDCHGDGECGGDGE